MKIVIGLLKNSVLWTAVGLTVLYWGVAPLFAASAVLETLNAILTIVGVAVFCSYAPGIVYRMSQTSKVDRVLQLSMGIALGWATTGIMRLWGFMWRKEGMPDWMQVNYFVGYMAFLTICAGILHITAPGAIDGVVPKRNWIIVGIAIAIGCALALFTSNLSFRWFIDFMQDYIQVDTLYDGWQSSKVG